MNGHFYDANLWMVISMMLIFEWSFLWCLNGTLTSDYDKVKYGEYCLVNIPTLKLGNIDLSNWVDWSTSEQTQVVFIVRDIPSVWYGKKAFGNYFYKTTNVFRRAKVYTCSISLRYCIDVIVFIVAYHVTCVLCLVCTLHLNDVYLYKYI